MKFIGCGFEYLKKFFRSLIVRELMSFFAFMIEDINKKLKDNVEDKSLATVAKTGSYRDLVDRPSIPKVSRNISSYNNDANYATFDDIEGKADKTDTYTKEEIQALISEADDCEALTVLDIWEIVKSDITN